jgi:hypothetical protein
MIHRAFSILLAMSAIATVASGKYSGGSGTAEDPYRIGTAADLITLASGVRDYDKHFIMIADVNVAPGQADGKIFYNAVIAPCYHTESSPYVGGSPFVGVFDGKGHAISGLTIKGTWYAGLFGQLALGATVQNLRVVDANVTGTEGYVGALVGRNAGTVTGCCTTGCVLGGWDAGGVVGENYQDGFTPGTVMDCWSTAFVGGGSYLGGLVGHNDGGCVVGSYSAGAVVGSWFIGGGIGYNHGSVNDCYSLAAVSGKLYVGGLVGENYDTVTQCYSAGPVYASLGHVGGLVGHSAGPVVNCFWDVEASGQIASSGGTGETTARMESSGTFAFADWELIHQTDEGLTGIWSIADGKDYPRLWWESRS